MTETWFKKKISLWTDSCHALYWYSIFLYYNFYFRKK